MPPRPPTSPLFPNPPLFRSGPAGSGKTTTIYACVHELARAGGRHIITIEDPVEQIIPGIMQTEINEARGLNYATATRQDRKSTRLNSSHLVISYAVFCLKKK